MINQLILLLCLLFLSIFFFLSTSVQPLPPFDLFLLFPPMDQVLLLSSTSTTTLPLFELFWCSSLVATAVAVDVDVDDNYVDE